jgi:hypothetical protein
MHATIHIVVLFLIIFWLRYGHIYYYTYFNTSVRRDMTISTTLICFAVLIYIYYLVERVK